MSATKRFNTRVSPTGRKARGDMVENNAGGYVFSVSDQERLLRILILGTDSPTIYLNADAKVEENATFLMDMAQKDGVAFVDTVVEVSTSGAHLKTTQHCLPWRWHLLPPMRRHAPTRWRI